MGAGFAAVFGSLDGFLHIVFKPGYFHRGRHVAGSNGSYGFFWRHDRSYLWDVWRGVFLRACKVAMHILSLSTS